MISIKALGMYSSDFSGGETRNGDTQIVTDGKYYDVIDGGCDRYATRLVTHLKANNIRDPYLHISHPHYDHRDGINKILSDPWFTPRALYCQNPDSITAHSNSIRSDITALRNIIAKAKKKNIPVIFLDNEDRIEHGEIKITVYRQYPKYSGNSDAYLNDGSLCYWFPEQRYLTTGDASMWCAYKYNLNPLIVKGGHHGNDMSADGYLKPSQMCVWLYKRGCRFYWDNDFSTRLTDFLMTGREDAINADMTFIDIHGDIDMVFACGKVTITHAGKTYTDSVPYGGEYIESWIKNAVGWWYRYKDGSWPADCMVDLPWSQGVDTFCFDKRGYMVIGWRKIEGKWYYFDENGAMVTGWRKINGKWYYLSRWESGAMVTGWQKLDGKMYYFDASGAMVTDWQKIGDKWYYFSAGGAMQTGWIVWKDAWFYLDTEDGHMHIGWLDYKNKRCYLDGSGRALCDCIRVIDGKTYQFDKDCYATELSAEASPVIPGTKVIDVSEFQPEDIDWHKLKAAGYAVIVRMGLRGSIKGTERYRKVGYDYHFKKYIAGVIAAGIPYSVYYFPTPLSDAEADEEADWIVMNTDGLNMSMPLWLDSEKVDKGVANDISTADRTRYLKRITDRLVAAGIPCGIYASTSWLNNQINMGQLQQQVRENTWCAQYADACTYSGVYAMWQYSSKARVPGIDDEVDISIVKRQFNMSCRKSAPKENAMTKDNVKIFPATNPVKISNSGSDENGNYKSGAAGDNTGREWQIRDWYNRPWNCVLRHPDPEVRACIADLATKAANNNKIGYDQYQRDTYWKELQKAGYDPSKITTACESDCSAGVIANIKAAGYILGKPELQNITCTYTGNMRAGLKAAGFACLTDSKYLTSSAYLVAGDVLLNDKHHTATAVTNGISSGNGDITASAMPLIKRGSKGAAVLQLQKLLNKLGYGLEEDSSFGPATDAAVRAYQKMSHLEVDGEVGPITWAALIEATK